MAEAIVTVEQGKLQGKTATDYEGKTYYSFQGIPYAKPPVRKFRFKDPLPADSWEGIRDATKEGDVSCQRNMFTGVLEGSEDCLFLNVYTPQIVKGNDKSLKPVMFWIHGGSFINGSGNSDVYGPEFLITHDIVLVTINYRLGILGFLKLDDPSLGVSGNQGLKDIVLALRWVKSNIHNFLGDSNNVTIFGESAGSAAVQYLLLSPLSKGLFHKAMMQSGHIFNIWVRGYHSKKRFSHALNLNTTNEREILEVLQSLPPEKILKLQEQLRAHIIDGEKMPYGPCVENPVANAFLPEEPKNNLQNGNYNKVPLLIGYTDAEGLTCIAHRLRRGIDPVHKDFEPLVPVAFKLEKGSETSKRVAQKIKEFYYKDKEPSLDTFRTVVQLESDALFIHGIHKTVENALEKSQQPVFLYRFSFDGNIYFLSRLMDVPFKAASHTDELTYLFKRPNVPLIEPRSAIDNVIKRMTKLWTNFAKYGNPNPRQKDELVNVIWKPATKNELNYLEIDEELSTGVNPEAERIAFWDSLYSEYPDAKFW